MIEPLESPYLVPTDGAFDPSELQSAPPAGAPGNKGCRKRLQRNVDKLDELQRRLYAEDRRALLLVFQAMDAAGKDSTIRAVMSGVNPAGCQVFSFKQPSTRGIGSRLPLANRHRLPERGRIGIFNRSYYEEVLVVRVHPEYLEGQRLPRPAGVGRSLAAAAIDSIRDHERHLARNGTVMLKFWLNVSREEQRQRFLSRLDEPEKNWKFSVGDVRERSIWDDYMEAYQDALTPPPDPGRPGTPSPPTTSPSCDGGGENRAQDAGTDES